MRKRRNILIIFVISALLSLGVGYAALTDSLIARVEASGSGADADVEDNSLFKIEWIPSTIQANVIPSVNAIESNLTSGVLSGEENFDSFGVYVMGFAVEGDKVLISAQFKVANCPDGYKASIEPSVQFDIATGEEGLLTMVPYINNIDCSVIELAKNETATAYFEITLNKTLYASTDEVHFIFRCYLNATVVKAI